MTVQGSPGRRLDELLAGAVPAGSSPAARICLACVRELSVTSAAVDVTSGAGHRSTVCFTDSTADQLQQLQFTLGEGPGIDAFSVASPVLIADLADPAGPAAARWPAFTPAAVAAGVRSVHAFPITLGAVALGSLDLYGDAPGTLTRAELTEAMLLAEAAAVALLDLRTAGDGLAEPRSADHQLDAAPYYRAEVHQATGMAMVQLGVSAEQALIRLRGYAFAHDRAIETVASDVVGLRLRLEPDPGL